VTYIALADRGLLQVAVAGSRIPPREWAEIGDISRVLQKAQTILAEAHEAAQSIRDRAHADGYTRGTAQAQALCAREMVEAQRVALEFVEASQRRIVSLSLGILARIAPRLGQGQLVAALLHEALTDVSPEQSLRVLVAPTALEATRAVLDEWQREHALVEAPRVIEDPTLEPFGCVVESDLGRIDAGLDAQFATIGDALTRAAAGPAA
jgi:flagellar biosynthesis/type III secretory pathway protein FliH